MNGRDGDSVLITGWGHTKFGRSPLGLEGLITEAVQDALATAGVEASDIDEIWFGNFNAGLQEFSAPASLALGADNDFWGVPVTHVENACASGSSAFHAGLRAVKSGMARQVLVIGAEKMTSASVETVGRALMSADFDRAGEDSVTGFAELFAQVAERYRERKGSPDDAMAAISHKNHSNGLLNPLAHLQKELSLEFCQAVSEKNPIVAGSLRRTDCSPVSDGAAAVVLSRTSDRSGSASTDGVAVIGSGQANDYVRAEQRDPLALAGSRLAWDRALESAGVGVRDLSFVELHDCFTIAELVLYEALGLAAEGHATSTLEAGRFHRDGELPVNVSGGLKAKGHPVGATGVSQHVMAAMQLTGTAGAAQLPNANIAALHNMGGMGLANNVSVLAAR
ncbi:thiolase domain-containing protein [Gulosibacter molinativorax]|uniref:Acetyl-CoA acetyltransferase n=1 Tax=Gulosibacter molinativorax TaxID=256821 RepID=A0ABT7C9H7_9MICO|nr:thiolase domain-containing protein [Gulosibacter molinativorax]MDJ1371874.1 acetyl-CoA acetyltransferase [Gulosibacter molinativorax]QUY62523.1 PaaJ protein [Gulosibacter molinativorax]